jgi:predicted CXXCH cytochrome family protein
LGTDLSDDHPISFDYDAGLVISDPELAHPLSLPQHVRLDSHGQMQCTTCHDSHSDTYDNFLVMDASYSALCTTCHQKTAWTGSTHDTSAATWTGVGVDPWPHTDWNTVAANGCENCHAPHGAGSPEWLLNFLVEEENCLSCHSGEVAQKDIASEIRKPFRHAVDAYLGVHDPAEDFATMQRHVECQDCHNPHASIGAEASAPNASGALRGVAGINTAGARVEPAEYEYEVCFRCHANDTNARPPFVERQIVQLDIQLKTDPANPSYHPVEGPGQNPDVPSLLFPLNESSIIHCTDCHANDAGPAAGGVGPAGPHGSNWRFLLEREYRIEDGMNESYQAYALCYKCHDRNSILAGVSFPEHKLHVDESRTSCAVCHDPHGISLIQGNPTNHSHLINFDISIALPEPESGRLEFIDLGHRAGECWTECHGAIHQGTRYGQ